MGWRVDYSTGVQVGGCAVSDPAEARQPGWRVGFMCGEECHYLPIPFGRKQDADAAKRTVQSMAEWPPDLDGARSMAVDIGLETIRRRMIESLQW